MVHLPGSLRVSREEILRMATPISQDNATAAAFAGGFIASMITLVLYRALGVVWAYQTPIAFFGGTEINLSVHYVVLIWFAVVLIWAVATRAKHFLGVSFMLAFASVAAPTAFSVLTA
jgi:hypothetical protein